MADAGAVVVSREQQIDTEFRDHFERALAVVHRIGQFGPVTDRKREQRMMHDQKPRLLRVGPGEAVADEGDLLLADMPVLEGQRSRGVDPQHGRIGQIEHRAQIVVDVALVTVQRRQEAAKHVVQRNVVIARNAEHFVALVAQPGEEGAGLLELLGPGALGEVAGNDDEVGLFLVDSLLDRLDQLVVVRAEMEVG